MNPPDEPEYCPVPDEFSTAEQQARLFELMARWRQARDSRAPFPAEDQAELESLVADELRAAAVRAEQLLTPQ